MEKDEVKYLKAYGHRINDAEGELSTLTGDERQHLLKLIHKYNLELELAEIAQKLGQGRLM